MNKYLIPIVYILLLVLIYIASNNEVSALLFLFSVILLLGLSALSFIYLQRIFNAKWSVRFENTAKIFTNLIYYSAPVVIILFYLLSEQNYLFDNELLSYLYNDYSILFRYMLFFAIWVFLVRRINNHNESGIKLTILLFTISVLAYDMLIFANVFNNKDIWFSAVFGIYFIISGFSGFLALLYILSQLNIELKKLERIKLAKMLFSVNILWAYVAFTQYLIISYGNLPKELIFYEIRLSNGWELLIILIAFLHFILPFLLLIGKKAKENILVLYIASATIAISFFIEMYWIIYPFFYKDLHIGWEVLLLLLMFGIAVKELSHKR